jgi:acyl-CoA reductase-like NAD-dependent aldehyde dehydrogenase
MKTITKHYIGGAFVESHGSEVMDIIKPINGQVIARVTLADEEDTRHAIAAAKSAFASFGRSTKDERTKILRRLHQAASARVDDLTAAMVEEYGGVVRFAGLIVQTGVNAFLAAEQALQELPLTRNWGKTTVTLEPVGVAGLITAWNANALFICLKLASAVAAGCTVVIKRVELASNSGFGRGAARGQSPKWSPERGHGPREGRRRRTGTQSRCRQDLFYRIRWRWQIDHARRGGNHEAHHAGTGRQIAHDSAR